MYVVQTRMLLDYETDNYWFARCTSVPTYANLILDNNKQAKKKTKEQIGARNK